MVRSALNKSNLVTHSLIERILSTGTMSRQEHLQLASALLADDISTDDQRCQINRVFDYIQIGRLKLID